MKIWRDNNCYARKVKADSCSTKISLSATYMVSSFWYYSKIEKNVQEMTP